MAITFPQSIRRPHPKHRLFDIPPACSNRHQTCAQCGHGGTLLLAAPVPFKRLVRTCLELSHIRCRRSLRRWCHILLAERESVNTQHALFSCCFTYVHLDEFIVETKWQATVVDRFHQYALLHVTGDRAEENSARKMSSSNFLAPDRPCQNTTMDNGQVEETLIHNHSHARLIRIKSCTDAMLLQGSTQMSQYVSSDNAPLSTRSDKNALFNSFGGAVVMPTSQRSFRRPSPNRHARFRATTHCRMIGRCVLCA